MRRLLLPSLLLVLLVTAPAASPGKRQPAPVRPGGTAIFYYPWYGTPELDGTYDHWDQGGHAPPLDLSASYYPARGPYSSSDRAVLREQMAEIAAAGIGEIVASWWGWGSPEDARLPSLIDAAREHGLVVSAHLEPYTGRTAESVEADIGHLQTLGVSTFYVYRPFEAMSDEAWAELRVRLEGVRLLAETTFVGLAAAARFDGIYTYDVRSHDGESFRRLCNQARVAGLSCAPSVGPGYDARRSRGDLRVKERRAGATYDAMWRAAISARPDEITITSYNEWQEGTQIEPARGVASNDGHQYESYSGAWGLGGLLSEGAYLARTAYWTRAYAAERTRPHRGLLRRRLP